MIRTAGIVLLILSASFAVAQDLANPPVLKGFVTRAVSSSNFDVNGFLVQCGSYTHSGRADTHTYEEGCPQPAPFVGEQMNLYEKLRKKQQMVRATMIQIEPVSLGDVSGSAVIDAPPRHTAAGLMVRADGYWILIGRKTAVKFETPLHALSDVGANTWLEYKAKARPDGVLVAREATFRPNLPSAKEQKFKSQYEFNPDVPQADAQRWYSTILGINFKRVPAWPDNAMEARVSAIGDKLVPAWQRSLPDSDPAKVHFRFQVVGGRLLTWVASLPSGIILVPHGVVDRLQNDSQLAAVLADAIATVLERQNYRMNASLKALGIAGSAGSWAIGVIPIYGTAALIGAGSAQAAIIRRLEEQTGRVSLGLMHDAGYDIDQAPIAWWRMIPWKEKPIANVTPNFYVVNLCHTLATVWRQPAPAGTAATTTAAQ